MPLSHQLRCLGTPTLYGEDGEAVRFRVKKHLALLAFLAMEPRTHRRDRLAELLWPAASEREGRHSLATGLSVLRARLGRAGIEAGRDTVRLVPGTVELDLDRLAAGDVLGSDIVPVLAVAPLLEDFDVHDAPGWNQWKDAQSANWRPRIRDALLTLIDRSRRHGDTRTMERLADSLLAIDSLSEEGVRSKMEARAFAGDRLSALRIFEEWKGRLADDVGAQPGDLIEGMAVRLRRRGWERTNKEHIAPVHTDQWKDRPFIGRGPQYRTLYEGWESTQLGVPKHVVITGDSGVGKSTLAARVTTAAGLQGAVSAREQCHEVARDVPYTALGALVIGLLDKPGAGTIAPEWVGELGRAVSEVRRRFPHAPPPLETDGETARIRIADAFIELVNAVAEEQPVILILDDLHLADDASISVLHLLLRRLEHQRVFVILTARPGEIISGGNAQRLLERADQVGLGQVEVPPLTPEEAAELLDSLIATRRTDSPTPAARRAIIHAAAGYPMVLELLMDDWLSHGEQCLALTLGGMTEQGVTASPSEVYRRILERLTNKLEPTSQNVLNLAAVLGARLNDFSLYGLADLTLAQAMTGLSRLAAVRILRDAGEQLEFINELMRAEAYVAVPSPVRRMLHSKVADQLIERADAGESMLGLEIAWHCIRARRKEEFARYLITGSDEAIEQGAHVGAERALLTAIPHLESGVKEQAQFRLALVLQDQGRWEESGALLATIDGTQLAPEALGDQLALQTIATIMQRSMTGAPDPEAFNSVLRVVSAHVSEPTRVRAAAAIASYAVNTLDPDAAAPTLRALDTRPIDTSRAADHAGLLLAKAQLVWPSRKYDQSQEYLDQAHALVYDVAPHSPLAARIALGHGVTLAATGRYLSAVPRLEYALRIAQQIGNDTTVGNCLAALAMCNQRLGHYEAMLEHTRRTARLGKSTHNPTYYFACRFYEAFALAMLNRSDEALESLGQSDSICAPFNGTWVGQAWLMWSADVLQLLGDERQALKRARQGLEVAGWRLRNLGLAGPSARWYLIIQSSVGSNQELDRLFIEQVRNITMRDATDQAEIGLAATADSVKSILTPAEINYARAAIPTHLPPATWTQIQRLGLLVQARNFNQSQFATPMLGGREQA